MARLSFSSSRPTGHLSSLPQSKQTIVFLHGLLSNRLEYMNVIPFLTDFHILIIDLPAHSGSSHIQPFDLPSASNHVAEVIMKEAYNGRAHVVGLSAGGFVSMELAKRYPDLVESLFVTGASPFTGWTKWCAERPNLLFYTLGSFINYCPNWLYWKMCAWNGIQRHDDLWVEMKKNFTFELVKQAYGSIAKFTEVDVAKISARTLAIAGGSQDDVEGTRRMGKLLRERMQESKAAIAKGALHAWDLQFPELFANSVRAWINKTDLPVGLEELS